MDQVGYAKIATRARAAARPPGPDRDRDRGRGSWVVDRGPWTRGPRSVVCGLGLGLGLGWAWLGLAWHGFDWIGLGPKILIFLWPIRLGFWPLNFQLFNCSTFLKFKSAVTDLNCVEGWVYYRIISIFMALT